MLVKALEKGFYNKSIKEPDEIFEYITNGELPSWVEPVQKTLSIVKIPKDSSSQSASKLKVADLEPVAKDDIIKRAKAVGINGNYGIYNVDTLEEKIKALEKVNNDNQAMLNELEQLKTSAIEKDIIIDTENKSVAQQISELKSALNIT